MNAENHLLRTAKSQILQAFSRALTREAHVLTRETDLLWQQLYNRLQWEDEPIRALVSAERDQRSLPECEPWFRTSTSFRQSEALLCTLSGHTDRVLGGAFSPDGTRIVSAGGHDHSLNISDSATGRELRTLKVDHEITACAVSPDGTRIITARGNTSQVWDASTGKEIHTPTSHTGLLSGCAVSPDGAWIISCGSGGLKMWEAATGLEKGGLPSLVNLRCLTLHPGPPFAVCGGAGLNLLELEEITYGPIIVTPTQRGCDIIFTCPYCNVGCDYDN